MATDNSSRIWFAAKRFGYGWYPVAWQGWLAIALFVVIVFVNVINMARNPIVEVQLHSSVAIICSAALLFMLCWASGPVPKWRWG